MSSRKEQKEAARQERLAKQQAAEAAERRKRIVGIGAAVALVAAIVVVLVVVLAGGGDGGGGKAGDSTDSNIEVSYPDGPKAPAAGPDAADLKAAAAAAKCRLVNPPNEGSTHVEESVAYRANPPTSGNHNPNPSEDETYTSPPQTERSVHSLEHGRIHIQMKPDVAPDVLGKLKSLVDEDPYHMLIYPNGTEMEPAVAVTAWDHQLLCPSPNDKMYDAIRAFKSEYRDKGPEFVP